MGVREQAHDRGELQGGRHGRKNCGRTGRGGHVGWDEAAASTLMAQGACRAGHCAQWACTDSADVEFLSLSEATSVKRGNRHNGTDDGSRSCPGNYLRGTQMQRRLETAPPSSKTGSPLTECQIQCTPEIETDTAQSRGSCAFSDTAQSSGLRLYASPAAYDSSASLVANI